MKIQTFILFFLVLNLSKFETKKTIKKNNQPLSENTNNLFKSSQNTNKYNTKENELSLFSSFSTSYFFLLTLSFGLFNKNIINISSLLSIFIIILNTFLTGKNLIDNKISNYLLFILLLLTGLKIIYDKLFINIINKKYRNEEKTNFEKEDNINNSLYNNEIEIEFDEKIVEKNAFCIYDEENYPIFEEESKNISFYNLCDFGDYKILKNKEIKENNLLHTFAFGFFIVLLNENSSFSNLIPYLNIININNNHFMSYILEFSCYIFLNLISYSLVILIQKTILKFTIILFGVIMIIYSFFILLILKYGRI